MMKPVVIVLVVLVLGWLGLRDLGILVTPQGRCMVSAQPSLLIGGSPSFVTELTCG